MEQEEYEAKQRRRLARLIQKESFGRSYMRCLRSISSLSLDEVVAELNLRLGKKDG